MEGFRRIELSEYLLPNGERRDFTLTCQIFGVPLHSAPVVLVNHALTGNSEVAGDKGWWKKAVGPGLAIDTKKYTVVAFDIPGNGYFNTPFIEDYKILTTKIIADLFWTGLAHLGIRELYAVVGGSIGGSIAWEMALLQPTAIRNLIPIATTLKSSDWIIGNALVQENILNNSKNPIEDARMHAMLLYRTPASFTTKFNKGIKEGKFAVESWLEYHGDALKSRFGLQAYKQMNFLLKTIGQDLTEEKIKEFAKKTTSNIVMIVVNSDYMFTKAEQEHYYTLIQKYHPKTTFDEIISIHGHDAFLIEYQQLNNLLKPIF